MFDVIELKNKIDSADIVSFDLFDTLLFRYTNTPEDVFDIVGQHFDIKNFRKIRIDAQHKASRKAFESYGYPHADIDQIYEALACSEEYFADWDAVKDYEYQTERDVLVVNSEMRDVFEYAREKGKRIIITSDMYFFAGFLAELLSDHGFSGIAHVYCSADTHKAKFNGDMYGYVAACEKAEPESILHIGDNARDDGEYATASGFSSYVYECTADMSKVRNTDCAMFDNGIYRLLSRRHNPFWYNLGLEIGGPLYSGLYTWLQSKVRNTGRKIFFISRDGYNLYKLCRQYGFSDSEYMYASRRSILLAGITDVNDDVVRELPPYSFGQTVRDLIEYLGLPESCIETLKKVGFYSGGDIISSKTDMDNFKKLYYLDKDRFLKRCEQERKNAFRYFSDIGFLDSDCYVFDCGWSGTSQYLLDRFKKAVGCIHKSEFLYFGIKHSSKSIRQLYGKKYDCYAFDWNRNYAYQKDADTAVVLYELFFSAPHMTVKWYDRDGHPVFLSERSDKYKEEISEGICDFVRIQLSLMEKYHQKHSVVNSLGHLHRLINSPDSEESVLIGSLENFDDFVSGHTKKYLAYVTPEQIREYPDIEIYWVNGLLKRCDVADSVKDIVRKKYCTGESDGFKMFYHLEDIGDVQRYLKWHECSPSHKVFSVSGCEGPKISVVMPVYNVKSEQLVQAVESVLSQSYDNYELVMVDDCSSWDEVRSVLRRYDNDEKIKIKYRTENGNISVATNDAIALADGDYIAFMDCDDILCEDALAEVADRIVSDPKLDFIYTDEDKISEDGCIVHNPFFKPDWSPDLFMCENYTNHFSVYRASIVREVGGLRSEYNGSQDYDFVLRFMEKSDNSRVGHIGRILYHWRERRESVAFEMASKNYAVYAGQMAKEDALKRRGIDGCSQLISGMNQFRIIYGITGNPFVSIVIPSKDNYYSLKSCIDSLLRYDNKTEFEIIVVDNGSSARQRDRIAWFLSENNAKYLYGSYDFNFSKMCNIGSGAAEGEYLLFMNDDVEVIHNGWLDIMVGHAQQSHVGAVGAKLFYPDTTVIQHDGVVAGKDGPVHNFAGQDDYYCGYFGFNWIDYNCLAVTAAFLLVAKQKFDSVCGFDEKYPIAYNDIDLCIRLVEKGYYNIVRNDVCAFHFESRSRSDDRGAGQHSRLNKDLCSFLADHRDFMSHDMFISDNISSYGTNLNLKDFSVYFSPAELKGVKKKGFCVVDFVEISDKYVIKGWSYLNNKGLGIDCRRYVVVTDVYGNMYKAPVHSVIRSDIASGYGKNNLVLSGFEAEVDCGDISGTVLQDRVGILTVVSENEKYISYAYVNHCCNYIDRNVVASVSVNEYLSYGTISLTEKNIEYNLERFYNVNGYAFFSGWSFMDCEVDYQYRKSAVIQSVDDGGIIKVSIVDEERPDVLMRFVGKPFLRNPGFSFSVFKDALPYGSKYNVYLRFESLFVHGKYEDLLLGELVFD